MLILVAGDGDGTEAFLSCEKGFDAAVGCGGGGGEDEEADAAACGGLFSSVVVAIDGCGFGDEVPASLANRLLRI